MSSDAPVAPLVARARQLVLDALELSRELEKGVLVPYGGMVSVAVVGLALRARRLTQAALKLTDDGSWLEAQILVRTLLEYVITLEWIVADPEPRVFSWWQADERSFDVMVSEVSTLISQRIELPPAEEAARQELIERVAKDAAAAGAPPYPSLQERARQVQGSLAYSLLFRLYSQGGTHPFRQSLLPLLEDVAERRAVLVQAEPRERPVDDPYYLCAVLLVIALEKLSATEPGLQLRSVEPLKSQLMDLKRDIDAEGE